MENIFKLKGVSMPQIKEKYLKDFRNIATDHNEDDEYVEVRCLLTGTEDFSGYPDLQISIMEEVDEETRKKNYKDYRYGYGGYVCVESFKLGKDKTDPKDMFVSTFRRDPVTWEDSSGKIEEIKPYSTLIVRSKTPEFVVGKSYMFGYKVL